MISTSRLLSVSAKISLSFSKSFFKNLKITKSLFLVQKSQAGSYEQEENKVNKHHQVPLAPTLK